MMTEVSKSQWGFEINRTYKINNDAGKEKSAEFIM